MGSPQASSTGKSWLALDLAVVFLGAFLLFQIQPVYSKYILPWFGGVPLVWATCLVFFQVALLGGYLYAHLLISRFTPRAQAVIHSMLLGLSLLVLPAMPGEGWKPEGAGDPTAAILAMLAFTVGLPYFLLASTSPLVQAWIASYRKHIVPYRLFGLSNLASILGLVSYPFLIEPVLGLRTQFVGWSGLYTAYVGAMLLLVATTLWGRRGSAAPSDRELAREDAESGGGEDAKPGWKRRSQWVTFAACPSILFLAVTNHLTQDVAPVPFLWILPLAIYLLTFVLCFEFPHLVPLDATRWGAVLFVVLVALSFVMPLFLRNFLPEFALDCVAVLVMCLFCHRELYERRPAPRHLTRYYVMVSVGGCFGGIFVGLIAPHVFTGYVEMYVGVAFCGILAFVVEVERTRARNHGDFEMNLHNTIPLFAAALAVGVPFAMAGTPALRVGRNFFGALKVAEVPADDTASHRRLDHGSTKHGIQFTEPALRCTTPSYYGNDSGIGLLLREMRGRFPAMRVGIIGLGVGTLAAYARPSDNYTFYEINPMIESVAREQFWFLGDCGANVEVTLGDARVEMEREQPNGYQIFVVDAFSGDSIPTHLLTEESFALYRRHLAPGGAIAVNISNRYLDLAPVVKAGGEAIGFETKIVEGRGRPDLGTFDSKWALLAADASVFEALAIRNAINASAQPKESFRWTDDYSNLFQALK